MLVLSRKIGERVLVGDAVVITVVRIGPNAVRLGIEAPKDMDIVRTELTEPESVLGELSRLRGVEFVGSDEVELAGCGDCREAHADCVCLASDA